MNKKIGIAFLVLALCLPLFGQNQRGMEIMEMVENRPVRSHERSEIQMILEDHRGRTRERSLELYNLDDQGREYSLMFFQSPSDVEGVGFLSIEQEDGDSSQWLFMPALGRSRRISSSSKDESFMGSDLSYEDLEPRVASEDQHEYLGEEAEQGVLCWKVETLCNEDSQYSRQISWIDPQSLIALRVDYFDDRNDLVKRLQAQDLSEAQGVWTAQRMTMEDLDRGRKTTLIWQERRDAPELSRGDFSVDTLEGGRL